MIALNVALTKLSKTALTTGKDGQPVLVIDIEACNLYKSDKGHVYLDLVGFDNTNAEIDADYSIKQSLPKEVREKEKEEEVQRPYLGTGKNFNQDAPPPPEKQPEEVFEDDDLPF